MIYRSWLLCKEKTKDMIGNITGNDTTTSWGWFFPSSCLQSVCVFVVPTCLYICTCLNVSISVSIKKKVCILPHNIICHRSHVILEKPFKNKRMPSIFPVLYILRTYHNVRCVPSDVEIGMCISFPMCLNWVLFLSIDRFLSGSGWLWYIKPVKLHNFSVSMKIFRSVFFSFLFKPFVYKPITFLWLICQ